MRFSLGLVLLLAMPVWAKQVTVTGKCEIKVTPDRGSVTLQTEKTAKTVQEAVATVTKLIDQARAAVQKMNLKNLELSTTQFQVTPHHEWQNNKNVFKGYSATMALEVVTSEITKLGEVMGQASAKGLTGTGNYRTFLSLEKSQAEYLRCLDVASLDARQKAQRLAKNLDAKLGDVMTIEEGQIQVTAPGAPMVMMEADMAKSAPAQSPSIDVADQLYSTNIRIMFKLN